MNQQTIGIYGHRDDLVGRLRDSCPSCTFAVDATDRDLCRLAIIDTDSHSILAAPPRKSLVRLILCDGSVPDQRRNGELRVERSTFMADPLEYIRFALEMTDAALHAAVLEQEVNYLSAIHEMMSMIEAEAVS